MTTAALAAEAATTGGTFVEVLPLALLDTLGVSTIAVPVWFLLMPSGLRTGRVFGYLLLVAAGYLALGLVLLGTLSAVRADLKAAVDSPTGDKALAVVGGALILTALWYGFVRKERSGPGRLAHWRDRAVGPGATTAGLLTVSLLAVVLEAATVFPYLAAIGTLDRSGLPWASQAGIMAVYCAVMVAPAALLTLARLVSAHRVRRPLRRIDFWFRDNARENTAWLFALAGFLLLSQSSAYPKLLSLVGVD
ncbi:GAP family protein [Streptomyces sp. NPDC097619]|uniref:GAP family protein n=1 Tax=Streptomyces sp. NPDC097619 TaxID=3157228 RepID=UPI00332658C9